MKKVLAIVLSVLLIVAIMPTTIADTFSVSGVFKYTINNEQVTIVGYTEEISGEITIPSEIAGHTVVALGDYAFYGCETITKVIVPSSVKVIGESAFTDSSAKEVVLNEGLEEIHAMAFGYSAITTITLPESLKLLDYGAFFSCTDLTYVKLPSTLTEIPSDAFCFCESLTEIEIPETVTSIGDFAFGATGITEIDIPDDVTYIGQYAFYSSALKTVMLPKNVTTVGIYAFKGNSNLETIWYTGSADNKAAMQIDEHNTELLNANWHLNTCEGDHSYTNVCDASCNNCDWTRTVEGHKYSNACDATCNNCGEERIPSDHVYDNTCDTTCNVCQEVRPIEHTYSNACDTECNICGHVREVGDHVYDDTCDTTCNECGNVRPIEHTYSNDCDTECNICGHIREVGDHVYDDTCDTDCNECGNVRPIEHTYDDIYDLECNVCSHERTVSSIAVSLLPSKITYYKGETLDTTGLQITVTLSDGATGVVTGYTVSEITNNTGKQTVTVTYLGATTTFEVEVVDYLAGDINGDGEVTSKDLTVLRRYQAGWDVTVIEPACDINKDGEITSKDITHFARYLAGWSGISI